MDKATPTLPPDILRMSFEEALDELEKIVRAIEEGKAKLDDVLTAYERGAHLRQHCAAKLREAEARIEKIVLPEGGGAARTAPFDT